MTRRPRVGLLGGTFDPVHNGHLDAALTAQQTLALDVVRFIPAARPPHRPGSPRASEYHRLEMLRLALRDGARESEGTQWEVSDLELRRDGPSYTYDTLGALHDEGLTALEIFFIIGVDAFAEIATWSRYPEVLDRAHFAVVARPGFSLASLSERLPHLADRMVTPSDLANSAGPRIVLVPSHTPDVSSTEIRRRAAAEESLEGLVPHAIASYIAQKHLYRRGPDESATVPAVSNPHSPDAPSGR